MLLPLKLRVVISTLIIKSPSWFTQILNSFTFIFIGVNFVYLTVFLQVIRGFLVIYLLILVLSVTY